MPGATWRDVVAAVLTEKKEAVSLEEIYKEVELYKKAQKINGGRKKFARLFNTIRITFFMLDEDFGAFVKGVQCKSEMVNKYQA